jgi:hypothetical protein
MTIGETEGQADRPSKKEVVNVEERLWDDRKRGRLSHKTIHPDGNMIGW